MIFSAAFKQKKADISMEYCHSAKWKPAVRILMWIAGYCASYLKNRKNCIKTWCRIENEYNIEITAKYKKGIDGLKIPSLPKGHYLRFDISHALKINPGIKRLGLVIYNGIGDYFLCTAFIKHLKDAYPSLAFDAYIPSYRKVLADLASVSTYFENTVLFNSSLQKDCLLPDLKNAYEKADKTTLIIPLFYDFRPSIHLRYLSLCHNFGIKPENAVPLPIVPIDYELSSKGKAIMSEIEEKFQKKQSNNGIAWLQLTSASADYTYQYPERLIKMFCGNGWLVICADKNNFKGDFAVNLSTGINDSIKILSLLNEKYKVFCVGIHSCFGPISSGLDIPCLMIQPYWDSRLKSVWHGNEFVVFSKKYPSIPDERQFIIKEYEKNPPFNITFSPEQIYSCFEKMLKILKK